MQQKSWAPSYQMTLYDFGRWPLCVGKGSRGPRAGSDQTRPKPRGHEGPMQWGGTRPTGDGGRAVILHRSFLCTGQWPSEALVQPGEAPPSHRAPPQPQTKEKIPSSRRRGALLRRSSSPTQNLPWRPKDSRVHGERRAETCPDPRQAEPSQPGGQQSEFQGHPSASSHPEGPDCVPLSPGTGGHSPPSSCGQGDQERSWGCARAPRRWRPRGRGEPGKEHVFAECQRAKRGQGSDLG